MADAHKQLLRLFAENKYVLHRTHKHQVWRGPDGRIFVLPSTPSDWRAAKNALTDFRRHISQPRTPGASVVLENTQIANQLAEKRSQAAAKMPVPRRGKRSKGTGIRIIEKIIKAPTPEEKTASLAAAAAERARVDRARQQRIDEKQFIASCVAFARRGAERLYARTERAFSLIETRGERFAAKFQEAERNNRFDREGMSEAENFALSILIETCDLFPHCTPREIINAMRGKCPSKEEISNTFAKAAKRYVESALGIAQSDNDLLAEEFVNAMDEWHASMAIVKYEPPLFLATTQTPLAKAA